MNAEQLERASSAVTLSDMEIFVFPELMYSLVLANILSPCIWRWLDDPWFAGIGDMKPYRRIQRLKQFIMDHYVFNLDLDTWGLTRQQKELSRFSSFLSPDVIAQSNALFGYQGDTYYFDIDIRTHFGLDKYGPEVIPYWKTETVEAMDSFRYRDGFTTGAGECVSLAALYAASLFIVAGIPLEDVFLMATPLHSQNFVDWADGVLINNRRLVTKAMWFNGSQISSQARRALENERVTIVSHPTGWIHMLYKDATISPKEYARFSQKLTAFLKTPLTPEILGNFLRQNPRCRPCFTLRCQVNGRDAFLPLEAAFRFEEGSPYSVTDQTREKLIASIPHETFSASRCPRCIILNDIEAFIRQHPVDLEKLADAEALENVFGNGCMPASEIVSALARFCHTLPKLPKADEKVFRTLDVPLAIHVGMTRDEILAHLESIRSRNVMAELAFYAWRDLSRTEREPFIKAALERNPVCIKGAEKLDEAALVSLLGTWPNESIYEGPSRFAQPDEVWNFRRGDGWEKALLVADVLNSRVPGVAPVLAVEDGMAVLRQDSRVVCAFPTSKSV